MEKMKPIHIINLKTYHSGKKALALAKKIERIDKTIIVGVQPSDAYLIGSKTKLPVYVQHVDFGIPGRNTGFVLPEAVKESGARGVFLNHSEHPLSVRVITETISQCKKIGLKTAVFAKNLREAKKIERLQPDYLIIESPELVAGTVSVTTAKPGLIRKIAKRLRMPFLVGAGIKTKKDIDLAVQLGASGVAYASVVTKARDPGKVLKGLIGR